MKIGNLFEMNNLAKFKLLGITIKVEHLIIGILLYMLITGHMICGSSKISLQEGLSMITGSPLDYKMGTGVPGSWDTQPQQKGNSIEWRSQDHDSYDSKMISPDKDLFFFGNTQFKPTCCSSTYSANGGLTSQGYTSGGCACLSKEQMNYLNTRGGNRTLPTEF